MCAWGWWLAGKLDTEAKLKKKEIRTTASTATNEPAAGGSI
jgi:hypothetical protein